MSQGSRSGIVIRTPLGLLEVFGGEEWRLLEVTSLDGVAGEITCPACQGSGIFLEPDSTPIRCADCKGSGKELITI